MQQEEGIMKRGGRQEWVEWDRKTRDKEEGRRWPLYHSVSFDQWSMGNRGSADSWSTAPEERSFTFLLALSPLLQNHF